MFVAPCGLPLALGCRRVWRLGYRRGAWWAGTGLGAVTVAASLLAGLLGPLAIAVYAAVISLPVWTPTSTSHASASTPFRPSCFHSEPSMLCMMATTS